MNPQQTNPSHDPLSLDNQLCFALYSTSLALTQFYKPLLEPLGLTYPQYLIMMILWREDGISLIDIARQLGQKPGALAPVLKRMADQGLLTKARSANDERLLDIHLTAQGRQLREQALTVSRCMFEQCGLEPQQIMRLKGELEALRQRFLA